MDSYGGRYVDRETDRNVEKWTARFIELDM